MLKVVKCPITKAKFPLIMFTMSKTKEYSSDVQQKIVEHHKIESGCKKIAKELKIPILTIRAIIKKL